MAFTKLRGNEQIILKSVRLQELSDEFLAGITWNVSSANDATITGLQLPVNPNDAANKDYVDDIVASATNWLKAAYDGDGDSTEDEYKLYPADPLVKRMEIKESSRGINTIYIENDNTSDNYTGASIVLTTDSADYTNQTFISHHGPSYYDSYLASRGAIMTDSSMIIGAYNSTDQQSQPAFVSFIVGDDYYNQKEIFKLTTDGLEMTLPDKKFWYEAGKTLQNHPTNYTQLFCNVSTSEVYAGVPSQLGSTRVTSTSNITLNDTQTVDGIALNSGDRVLVQGQTDATENGLYICLSGADWTRAGDLPDSSECSGKIVIVNEGDTYADTLWEFSNDAGTDVVGTDDLTLKLMSSGAVTAGSGLSQDSTTIKLGGSVTETANLVLQDDKSVLISAANYYDSGKQLNCQFYGGSSSGSNPGSIQFVLMRDYMYDLSAFYLNKDAIQLTYDDGSAPSAILRLNSNGGTGVGDANVWKLENTPDGTEPKAIATVDYVDASVNNITFTESTERFIITSTDASNKYIDLSNTPESTKHLFVYNNGIYLDGDSNGDYSISTNRITFEDNVITEDDKVIVKYSY